MISRQTREKKQIWKIIGKLQKQNRKTPEPETSTNEILEKPEEISRKEKPKPEKTWRRPEKTSLK